MAPTVETSSDGSYFMVPGLSPIPVEPGVWMDAGGSWFWLTEREYVIEATEEVISFRSKGSGMVWSYERRSMREILRVTAVGEDSWKMESVEPR